MPLKLTRDDYCLCDNCGQEHGATKQKLHFSSEVARLTNALAREEAAHMKTLEQRDSYHDTADDLTDAISKHFGQDFGEHSSANSPWANALEFIQSLD